jgi:hypothetical protein
MGTPAARGAGAAGWAPASSGGVLASFCCGKGGCLRSLTKREQACVRVAVEMPFSSTLAAAAGATERLQGCTERLRGWLRSAGERFCQFSREARLHRAKKKLSVLIFLHPIPGMYRLPLASHLNECVWGGGGGTTGQPEGQTVNEAEGTPSVTDRQSDAMRKEHTGVSPTWWRDSWYGAADKPYDGEINMQLRWTQAFSNECGSLYRPCGLVIQKRKSLSLMIFNANAHGWATHQVTLIICRGFVSNCKFVCKR